MLTPEHAVERWLRYCPKSAVGARQYLQQSCASVAQWERGARERAARQRGTPAGERAAEFAEWYHECGKLLRQREQTCSVEAAAETRVQHAAALERERDIRTREALRRDACVRCAVADLHLPPRYVKHRKACKR